MWFKKKREAKKRTKKISEKKVQVDVGVTRVRVYLQDGSVFVVKVYGQHSAQISVGQDECLCDDYGTHQLLKEPVVYPAGIYHAEARAKHLISDYGSFQGRVFVDDEKSTKTSIFGTATKFEILDTEPYVEEVTEYFIEDVK